jgi:hypothetical protein
MDGKSDHRPIRSDAISFQVSLKGRGLSALTKKGLTTLVERYLDEESLPDGVEVRIQCWRQGRELAMIGEDNHRAETLRETFRRLLRDGRIELALR